MKPFDLELAKKGDKIITRCGFRAVLYCFSTINNNSIYIVCSIFDKYDNSILSAQYTQSGKFIKTECSSDLDLFMAEDSDFEPKDEKPVYYIGDMDRGDEIIAELEKRGGKNREGMLGNNPNAIYYITNFGLIDWANLDEVKDSLSRFTELHLPPKKVKKEGWINWVDYGLSKLSCIIPYGSIYDSESEAKEAVKRFDSTLKNFKTIKIGWEEEEK